jgi:hypothetical protein
MRSKAESAANQQTIANLWERGLLSDEILFGSEFEIEAVQSHPPALASNSLVVVEDGSLRNSGYEYKTTPLNLEKSLAAFKYLHQNIKLSVDAFTERTSIHVHVNMGSFTEDEVKNFLLLYALYEPLFFRFAGQQRQSSIFCVPLTYTTVPRMYNRSLSYMTDAWHKYTAFNIKPLKEFGTVEFRHLGGTNDHHIYYTWLQMIKNMYMYVADSPTCVLNHLDNKEMVVTVAREVLPAFCEGLSNAAIADLLYDTLLDVKLSQGILA